MLCCLDSRGWCCLSRTARPGKAVSCAYPSILHLVLSSSDGLAGLQHRRQKCCCLLCAPINTAVPHAGLCCPGQPICRFCCGTAGLAMMFAGCGGMRRTGTGATDAAANDAQCFCCWARLPARYTIKEHNMQRCLARSPGVAELPSAAGASPFSNVTFREILDAAASCAGLGTLLPSKPAPTENA